MGNNLVSTGTTPPAAGDIGLSDVGWYKHTSDTWLINAGGERINSYGVFGNIELLDVSEQVVRKNAGGQSKGVFFNTTGMGFFNWGLNQNVITASDNGGVFLAFAGNNKLNTNSSGAEVTSAGQTQFVVHNTSNADQAQIDARNNAGTARFNVTGQGDAEIAVGDENGNNLRLGMLVDSNGSTYIYHRAADRTAESRLQTIDSGVHIDGRHLNLINPVEADAIMLLRSTHANVNRGVRLMQESGTDSATGISQAWIIQSMNGAGSDIKNAITGRHGGQTVLHYNNAPRVETTPFGATVSRGLTDRVNLSVVNKEGGTTVWFQGTTVHHSHSTSDGSIIRDYLYSYEGGPTVLNHGANGFGSVVTTSTGGLLNGSWVGNLSGTSDERLKKNISHIEKPLETMLKLEGYTYDKESEIGKGDYVREMGIIANDAEKVVPELVHTSEEGDKLKSVYYGNGFALTIEAMRELSDIVESQKTYIERLEERIAKLERSDD